MKKEQFTQQQAKELIQGKLSRYFGVAPTEARKEQLYKAVVMSVRDIMLEKRHKFHTVTKAAKGKRVYYMCMEFLMGRSLKNSLYNLGVSDVFAEALKESIESHGGKVITGDGVAKIFSQDRMITGVRTRKGLDFSADYYICAIHPCSMFGLLDDPSVLSKAYRNRLEMIPNSYSAFTVNIKLKPVPLAEFLHDIRVDPHNSAVPDRFIRRECGIGPHPQFCFLHLPPASGKQQQCQKNDSGKKKEAGVFPEIHKTPHHFLSG